MKQEQAQNLKQQLLQFYKSIDTDFSKLSEDKIQEWTSLTTEM